MSGASIDLILPAIRTVLTMTLRKCSRAAVCLAFLLASRDGLMAQEDEAGTFVEGIVKDTAGEPLGGITVRAMVFTEHKPQARSSADGRFRLAQGTDARSSTMLLASNDSGDLQGFLQINPNDPSRLDEPVEIVLKPPREIDVVVRDADGQPVEDAEVEVAAGYRALADGLTGADGVWRTGIPADAPVGYVIALKDGAGFDFYQNALQYEDDPNNGIPRQFEFTLEGALQVEVLAATDDGEPVSGVEMLPWYIQTGADRAGRVNLSGSRIVRETTDEGGIAVFRWFPAKFEQSITVLMRSDEWHAPEWPSLRAGAIEHRLTYRLRRMVPISGRVLDANGRPASGIPLQIAGEGANSRDNHRATVVSDEDGRYQALVPPQLSYIIAVVDDDWASDPLMDVPIYLGRPRDDLDLTLIPGTLVHGSVRQPDGTPLARQYVMLRLDGQPVPFKPDDDSRFYHAPMLSRSAVTDEDGRYELRAGPGTYHVWGPDRRSSQELTIADQAELQLDFEFQPPTKQPLTGRVVRADDEDAAVPDVVVSGVQIDPEEFADISAESDEEGRFATERFPSRMLLHAMSSDGALGATQEIQQDDTEVVIAVSPTSSGVGRIVDEAGQPTPGFRFRYAIEVKFPNDTMTSRFGGTAFTDDEGRFRLEHLIVNQEYECRHEREGVYYLVTKVTAPDAEPVDLGTLIYPRSQRGRTYLEWLRDAFTRSAVPDIAVGIATRVAALDGRRVLLIESSDDDEFVRSLFRVFDDDSRTWDRERDPLTQNLKHFVLACVSPSDAPSRVGRLVVLDHDQSVVAEAAADELTGESGELDATLLTQFLEAHTPAPVNAEERMAQAMEASADSGKPILVVQVAAHDDESELMLEYVAMMRGLLEQHFILFPVADHMSRGRELTRALRESLVERYVDRRQRQVPWTAIIDAGGARLAAAEINENTVGFPTSEEEVDVFLSMLQQVAPDMTDVELKALADALVPGT